MTIREVQPEEYALVGAMCVQAYDRIGHFQRIGSHGPTYRNELQDVETRARKALVLVAADDNGAVLGAITYVPDNTSALAEFSATDAASFRMLAVSPATQGRGTGRSLVSHCVERARQAGKRQIIVHSTPWMEQAHHLYESLGFLRTPELDWRPVPQVPLLAFVCDLRQD